MKRTVTIPVYFVVDGYETLSDKELAKKVEGILFQPLWEHRDVDQRKVGFTERHRLCNSI